MMYVSCMLLLTVCLPVSLMAAFDVIFDYVSKKGRH
jgi:hypothetical protein